MRELYLRVASNRGHLSSVGTAASTADVMQEWYEAGACDGFMVMPPASGWGLTDFTEAVVPELQRRGLFRTEYEGTTLRQNLGLAAA